MTRTERKLARYEKYFGDIVDVSKRLKIAECGAIEDKYISLPIYRPKPRQKSNFDGIRLNRCEVSRVLREIIEEMKLTQ